MATIPDRRHSSLKQITPANVGKLGLAWAFQTNQPAADQVLAAAGGWHLVLHRAGQHLGRRCAIGPPDLALQLSHQQGRLHIGHRGVAMYKGWLFFMTPDAHLISLNAKDGTVRWNVQVADVTKGYWTTMAPLIVRDHVIVGVSGDFDNLTGFLRSIDPETGKTQWQWDSTPPVGTPNSTTGGMTWMTGTYDPDLNLIYWGTGQSHARAERQDAPRRRSLHLQHRGAQSRYRQTGLGFSSLAARHPRLGCRRDAGAGGRRLPRQAAQDADADLAQRLLLRPRPHQRQEPAHRSLRPDELGAGRRQEGQPNPNPAKNPRPTAGSSLPTKAA